MRGGGASRLSPGSIAGWCNLASRIVGRGTPLRTASRGIPACSCGRHSGSTDCAR
jgi:hypothetical protein